MICVLLLGAGLRLWSAPSPPPALNVDEAANGEDVLDILAGHLSIFFPRVNGREPLFIYTQAVSVAVLGRTPLGMRFPMLCFGVLTLAATYLLGRDWFNRWVGLLAAASLGTAFWHLTLTRTGLRTGAVPLFVTLCMYSSGRALKTGRRRDAVLAGLWLALGLYTYLSARLIALALIAGVVVAVVIPRLTGGTSRKTTAFLGLLAGLTTLVLVAPLAVYFAGHPEYLFERVGQVTVFNPDPHIIGEHMGLGESLVRTAGGLFVHGDDDWKQNLPGRPVFDPGNGLVWVVGAAVLLIGLLRAARSAEARPFVPEFWLLLWPAAVLGGMALAQESPYFPRQSAAIPAVHLCWAVGAWWLVSASQRFGTRAGPVAAGAVALLLTVQTASSARDLFLRWGQAPETWQAFDGDIFATVAALRGSHDDAMDPTRMVIQLDASSGIGFPLPQMHRSVWVRQYSDALPFPIGSGDVLFVYPHLVFAPPFQRLFPDLKPELEGTKPAGGVAYLVYRLSAAELSQAERPAVDLDRRLSSQLSLLGLSHPMPSSTVPAGASTTVDLLWRVETSGRANYGLYVHLLDSAGRTWALSDDQVDLTNGWEAGETVLSSHTVTVPSDAPPGHYRLVAGAGLRSLDEQPSRYLQMLGDEVSLGELDIGPPNTIASSPPQVSVSMQATFDGVALVGHGLVPATARQGQTLEVPVEWRKLGSVADVSRRLVLRSSNGAIVAGGDEAPPGGSAYPFARWSDGRYVRDFPSVAVGAALPAGPYDVVLLVTPTPSPESAIPLGSVVVAARARTYTLPRPTSAANVTFGSSIRFLGYDVSTSTLQPGRDVTFTLYWQALDTPQLDLTAFVHLLGPDNRVVAQRDAQPLGGDAPTTGWLPGEVITDRYTVAVPGSATAPDLVPEIGWYDARTGKRLPISSSVGSTSDTLAPLPLRPAR